MACTCFSENCTQETIGGVVFCNCPTIIENIVCPENCEVILLEDGNAVCSCTESVDPISAPPREPISFDNTTYFKEVSWTIAYKPTEGRWVSYYSFLPDFYVNHQQHFQVGFNYGTDRESLWSHMMNNNSYQVFQGKLQPFTIEFPIVNQGARKLLETISLEVESRRYQNQWDYAVKKGIGFNQTIIYNSTNNSGVLNLNEQKTLRDTRLYPITNNDGISQEILYSSLEGKHIINYFFNRVISQENNVPHFLWDDMMINKNVNSKAISFLNKKPLERLRGDYFMVRLSNTKESRYQINFNKSLNSETIYE